jgi:hypothetical protein
MRRRQPQLMTILMTIPALRPKHALSAVVDHCEYSRLLARQCLLTSPRDPTTGAGVCGAGPKFCGTGCTSQCSWKSECDPGWGIQWSNASTCPLNVCCSGYGFCGTTSDFCGGAVVSSPQCSGKSSDGRTIGYYEGWNGQRACGSK